MTDNYLLVDVSGNATEVSGEVKIGRNKTNELVISDPLASRHHATVYMGGETLMIRDEGSSNGTYVNGAQIYEPTPLNDMDKIQFGDEEFTVRAPLWDSATIRAPKDEDEPVVEAPKKAPETFNEPRVVESEATSETVITNDGFEAPKKDNNKLILIIAAVVLLLCVCCVIVIGSVFIFNRNSPAELDFSGSIKQLELLASLVLAR